MGFGWKRDLDGHLVLGSERVETYVERFGSPLYLYDLALVDQHYDELRRGLRGFEVSYAVKANPNGAICRRLAELGATAGVSSARDLDVALRSGFDAASACYVGPGKSAEALADAVDRGVGLISLESLAEGHRLNDVARARNVRLRVLLRINTHNRASAAGEIMAGGASPFGIDQEEIPLVVRELQPTNLDIVGFHTFVASQVLSRTFLTWHFETVAAECSELAQRCGLSLEVLNFGGGFGVQYSADDAKLSIAEIGEEILAGPAGTLIESGIRCVVDVGRYLTAQAGLFLTRVIDVKLSRGIRYVVVESGLAGMARPAMPWGQQHPVSLLQRSPHPRRETFTVVGPSCMPGDVLCTSVQMSRPAPGDIIAVYNAGAYGLAMSPLAWGGFDVPSELAVGPDREEDLTVVQVEGVY